MLKNFYTTQMNGNKKVLQKRFIQIRKGAKCKKTERMMAFILTVSILITIAFATIAVAASSSDGLENWTQNENYVIATMKGSIQADINRIPQWAKDISSDGNINFQVDRAEMRKAVASSNSGNIENYLNVKFYGDIGTAIIEGGLNAATTDPSYAFCNFVAKDENDDKAFVLWFRLDENKDIDEYYACVTTKKSDDLAFSHLSTYKENYIPVSNVEYIGDFPGILKAHEYFTFPDYFTNFETVYQNKNVDGIDIKINEINDKIIKLHTDISRDEPDIIKIRVARMSDFFTSAKYETINISEIDNQEITIGEEKFRWGSFKKGESYFIPGEKYVVDFILLKAIDDNNSTVIYRQREYITIL